MSNNLQTFTKGLIKENPILVLLLGCCPTLATTTSAINHHLRAGAVEYLHFTLEGLHPRQGAYPLLHRGHRLLRDGGATRHAGIRARHL